MNNFVKRTLSGFLFVLLIVGSILLSSLTFAPVFAFICAWSVYEFHKLSNKQPTVMVNPLIGLIGGVLLFLCSYLYASGIWRYPVYSIYGFYIVLVLISELYRRKENPLHNWAYFILGQIFIALPFSILNFILFIDKWQPLLLLAVFVTIWVNDTGAYLTGVTFGRHRLFERISPKKSWEGFIGGALAALLSGYVFSLFIPQISLFNWFIFSEIIVIFGTFGDLIESLMKRTVDVKDSGNVIPGHGGLLDRFDSMLLAAPVIFIYLSFLFNQVLK
ncbi:MAG: phosphatidate cytidylyltransferase [Bacteroidota bacterium]|nr:phosphatidate cytidylyltransferase [Bacteroidota bacterium]